MDVFKTFVVNPLDVDVARQTGEAAGGGPGMFSVPLADAGAPTVITRWACSGNWPQSVVDVMWPSACDISEDQPLDMMARLGLVMWQDPNGI